MVADMPNRPAPPRPLSEPEREQLYDKIRSARHRLIDGWTLIDVLKSLLGEDFNLLRSDDESLLKAALVAETIESAYAKGERSHKAAPVGFVVDEGSSEPVVSTDARTEQVGGRHYKDFELQPAEIAHRNNLTFLEGCAVKRLHRHSRGGKGIEDLRKAIHEIRLIAKFTYKEDI